MPSVFPFIEIGNVYGQLEMEKSSSLRRPKPGLSAYSFASFEFGLTAKFGKAPPELKAWQDNPLAIAEKGKSPPDYRIVVQAYVGLQNPTRRTKPQAGRKRGPSPLDWLYITVRCCSWIDTYIYSDNCIQIDIYIQIFKLIYIQNDIFRYS